MIDNGGMSNNGWMAAIGNERQLIGNDGHCGMTDSGEWQTMSDDNYWTISSVNRMWSLYIRMVCYHVIAGPCVHIRSVDCVFTPLVDDSECFWTMSCFYYLFFSLDAHCHGRFGYAV